MWGITFKRQTENVNDNGNASVAFILGCIYFQSTTQGFNKGKTKFSVKFSANLYHGDIMPKCGFLQGGSPIGQRGFCFTHLSGDDFIQFIENFS